MLTFFSTFKANLYNMHTKDRISSINGHQSFQSWAQVCFATIQSMFTTISTAHMFRKCGYEIPNANISQHIMQHITSDHLGMIRKLTINELSEYVGCASSVQHGLLFNESIPESMTYRHIVVRNPMHRLRSKSNVHGSH